jgi:hypothetical protein
MYLSKILYNPNKFTQPALIDSIIEDMGISNSKTKPVPAKVSLQLHAFKNEQVFDLDLNYSSVVGKLNYLARLLVLISCMLHIKLPSTHQIQGNCMVRQLST